MGNVQALLAMAHDRSRTGREHLASAVSDLFAENSTVLSDSERAIMNDILNQLVKDVEISVRLKLAHRLADVETVPRALMVELANDEIEIAAPVLSRSKVLQDIDLIEIVRHRSMEHQLAIAMRESVEATVSDALVETGNDRVVETLLRNRGAILQDKTLATIVDQSREHRNYQEPLLRREELSPELAKRMYRWVSAAIRSSILERYDLNKDDFDDALESATGESVGEIEHNDTGKHADGVAETPRKIDEDTQNELVDALRKGEVTLFQMELQKVTGLRLPFLRAVMFEPGGERLAIICRAIKMTPKFFSAIYRLLRAASLGATELPRGELTRIASLYLDIKPNMAETVLHNWCRDPDYSAPIETVMGKPS